MSYSQGDAKFVSADITVSHRYHDDAYKDAASLYNKPFQLYMSSKRNTSYNSSWAYYSAVFVQDVPNHT